MDANRVPCFFVSMFITLALCFALVVNPSNGADVDRLSPGQSISGNQTLVSHGGKFELGFFSPGKTRNYYIGIWFNIIPSKDVIWVPNRRTPFSDPSTSELKLTKDGNLVLLDQNSNTLIWSSNSTITPSSSNSIDLVLLDTGNLVISSSTSSLSSPIWQSFDHPSHTWMPGAWIGLNKHTGEYQSLTSWRTSEDPSPGLYTTSIDQNGTDQYVMLYNGSLVYWTTGIWLGRHFAGLPELSPASRFTFSFTDDENGKRAIYMPTDPSVITYTLMDPSGQIKQLVWVNSTTIREQWLPIYYLPPEQCQIYAGCGAFGLCDSRRNSDVFCSCFRGFKPALKESWDLGAWSSGCIRNTSLHCNQRNSTRKEKDGFFKMQTVRLPSNPQFLRVGSAEECSLACQNNCSCSAYAYDRKCSIWYGDLWNAAQLYDGDSEASTLYLRLAAADLPPSTPNNPNTVSSSSHKHSAAKIILIIAGAVLLIFVVAGLMLVHRKRSMTTAEQVEGSLISFTYSDMKSMTKNFSEKLGGGGFGSVFKGTMPDSTVVAVKKLEGSRQGEKQFRTEVSTLGTIQHVNLVRLRGFCCEGSKRLLVYDYMPEGSLDVSLFENSRHLEWSVRYKIILGIARGLAYLHEKCRECIVHCDIKPDNILLDNEFSPKVADLGMAKLIGRDFSKVLTTMRGTIGYLAPEWITGLPITPKVDVYSFGMLLFEMISGKRNSGSKEDGSNNDLFFPVKVASRLTDYNLWDLVDERLAGEADMVELNRVCRVACWCIQDLDSNRPTMGQVVQILEGVLDVQVPSIPRYIQNLMEDPGSVYFSCPMATNVVHEDHSAPFYSLPLTDDEQNAI